MFKNSENSKSTHSFTTLAAPATALMLFVVITLGVSHEILADEPFPAGEELSFKTGGSGVFVPANLGLGDPDANPAIIGDGLGLSTYNGTPTGKECHLNGKRVGDGWDQHFGAAQSTGAPRVESASLILYDIVNAPNPIDPTRSIHIMKTRRGEVWFEYGDDSFFTLDFTAGTLTHDTDFVVLGGTKLFAGATGLVNVVCVTLVGEVDFSGPVSAPFRYDFDGTIVLAENDDDDDD